MREGDRPRREDNIKMDIKDVGGGSDWIYLTHNRDM
jgi:hypothetical protein